MKKALAIILSIVTVLSFAAIFASCGGDDTKPTDNPSATTDEQTTENTAVETDLDYVKKKGKLVVGITDFKPMDYKEKDSDEWIGFDADMAKAFAKSLGVEAEFVVINWDFKITDLQNKSIDCVWNGMTLTDDVKAKMETSKAYMTNAQVIVVPSDKAEKYAAAEACKDLSFAVEGGSAGKEMAEQNGFKFTEVQYQSDAVNEVASGTSDAAIIDLLMAGAMIGKGTGYENLTYTAKLNSEDYGVGFRKGSPLAKELDNFFASALADGSMLKTAEKYGVQESLIK